MNLPVPPWVVRRLLVAPLIPLLATLALAALPVVVAVDGAVALARLVRHRRRVPWRLPRVYAFGVAYLLGETACLVALLLLWVASGFGLRLGSRRMLAAHTALLRVLLAALVAFAGFVFRFRLVVDEPETRPEDQRMLQGAAPVLVLGRHGGPGASFVLVHLLLSRYRRRPRVVLTDRLRWDPCLDVLLSRLDCGFVRQGDHDAAVAVIARVASSLAPDDALLLYPEGGDWTPTRHARAVARLRRKGKLQEAAEAEERQHVLPPRPAGTLAALAAAPDADVVVFTHTGHDDLQDAATVWRALPLRRALHMIWWREPSEALPRTDAGRAEWLRETWGRIDAWIDEQESLSALS